MQIRWTDEVVRQLDHRQRLGKSFKALGKEFGVTGSRIAQVIYKRRYRLRQKAEDAVSILYFTLRRYRNKDSKFLQALKAVAIGRQPASNPGNGGSIPPHSANTGGNMT